MKTGSAKQQRVLETWVRGGGSAARPDGGWKGGDMIGSTLRLPPDLHLRLNAHLRTFPARLYRQHWILAAIGEKLDKDEGAELDGLPDGGANNRSKQQRMLETWVRGGGRAANPESGWGYNEMIRTTLRLPPDLYHRLNAHLRTSAFPPAKQQWILSAIGEKLDKDEVDKGEGGAEGARLELDEER